MGIYDRDYYRDEQPKPGVTLRAPRSAVVVIILINVGLYLVDGLFFSETHDLTNLLRIQDTTLTKPWMWWQFLTYGFVHSAMLAHIFGNMLQLFFLGRAVEQRYGTKEFVRLYLVMIVAGSVCWAITNRMSYGDPTGHTLVGASGAVCGVVLLFVLNYPKQTLILFPIPIPIKAWVLGLFLVVINIIGAHSQHGNVAFGVHLTGIIFAYLYFQNHWNLGQVTNWLSGPWFKSRHGLRLHDPDEHSSENNDLSIEVDRILEKIHQKGENSLSRKERRTLETASREYQQRRGEGT